MESEEEVYAGEIPLTEPLPGPSSTLPVPEPGSIAAFQQQIQALEASQRRYQQQADALQQALAQERSSRQQAEARLQQTQEHLTFVLQATQDAIYDLNLQTNCIWWNESYTALFGSRPRQTQDCWQWWRDHVHPDDRDRVAADLEAALQGTGDRWLAEYRYQRRDGTYADVVDRAYIVRNQQGTALRLVGSLFDLTERKQDVAQLKQTQEHLRVANERFQFAATAVSALIYDWDIECDHVERTEGLTRLLGYSLAEAEPTGDWWRQQVHPEDLERILKDAATALTQRDYYTAEYRILNKQHSYIHVLDQGLVVARNEIGQPTRVIGSTTDISDRKQAEAALRASAERLSLALTAAKLGDWSWDATTDIVTFSDRAAEIFGIPPGPYMTWTQMRTLLHEADRDRAQQSVEQAIAEQSDYDIEYRVIHPDGTLRWVAAKGRAQYTATGQAAGMLGVVQDITDRKRAEQEIQVLNQDLEQRVTELQTLLDVVPVGIAIAEDPQCQTIRANAFFQKIFNVKSDANLSVTGAGSQTVPVKRLQNGKELLPDELPMQMAAAQGIEVRNADIQIVRADGATFDLLGSATPLFDDRGQGRGSVAVFMDISDRKRAEAEREHLLERERLAREQAEAANRIKDEFLAVLSHELRTPLNPILGWVKLLRTGALDAQKTALALETIERNAKLQTQLIEDLLDISRILQGKLTLDARAVDLVVVLESARETFRLAAEAKGIDLQLQILEAEPAADPSLPRSSLEPGLGLNSTFQVIGDASRLQQAVWNLLSNALKFTPAGGRVEIKLERISSEKSDKSDKSDKRAASLGPSFAQITVTDTGKGIRSDFLPHVFEYFRQADSSTTRKFGGLGLGLAIVRQLVELHGGTVEAASPGEGLGATFTVCLPLVAAVPAPQFRLPLPPQGTLPNLRVLVVEDEADARDLFAFILTQAGAEVTTAASAEVALSLFLQSTPDVVVSDIGLPNVDGYSFLRQIRSLEPAQGRDVPAIALTAYAGESDRQQAFKAGFQRHLPKPIEPAHLIQAIVAVVNRS